MTTFVHNGIQHEVMIEGDKGKPPLILLHGFAQSSQTWSEIDKKLVKAFYVIAPDFVGHGKSEHPKNDYPYSFKGTTEFLDALIDEFAQGCAVVLGYSMGGRIALTYAFQHPQKMRALILESAGVGLSDEDKAETFKRNEALVDMIEHEGIEAFMNYWEQLPLFASQKNLPASIRDRVRKERLSNRGESLMRTLRGSGQHVMEDYTVRLGELDMPLLYIAGEQDVKYCSIAATFASQGAITSILQAGHNTHLEAPESFVAAVIDFYNMSYNEEQNQFEHEEEGPK